jgi:MFS family permease
MATVERTAAVTGRGPTYVPLGIIIACGCVIGGLSFGMRSSFGLFTEPLSSTLGWGREIFAVAIAIQNLGWGVGQAIAGALSDRFGPARVLAGGGLIYALGLVLMAYASSPLGVDLTAGVLAGLGMSGCSYITVLAALGRIVPPERRSWVLGIGTAAGSVGQFLVVPLGQAFISAYGWQTALILLGAMMATIPFLSASFAGAGAQAEAQAQADGEPELTFGGALRQAFGDRSYLLLVTGFGVCGFQLAFITVHMPPYLADSGISPTIAAWAIGLIGLFNILGAYGAGVLGARFLKKNLLSLLYLGRGLAIAAFVMLPVTPASVFTFAAVLGVLWLATAPLSSGIVASLFGTRYLSTLFGIAFFAHQIGSFFGVLCGGWLYAATGSYVPTWWTCVILSLLAALINLPIREHRADAPAAAPQAAR